MRGRWLPIHPSLDMSSGNQNERDKRGEMENQPAYSRMFIPYFALTRLLLPRFDYSQERIISCPRVPGDVLFRFVTESLLRQSLVFNSPVRDDGVFSHILFLGRLQLTCGVHIDLAFLPQDCLVAFYAVSAVSSNGSRDKPYEEYVVGVAVDQSVKY